MSWSGRLAPKFRQTHGARVGEFCVREADAFQIRQMLAEFLSALVVDATAAVADSGELSETLEFRVSGL